MPGVKSLEERAYYAHPQNAFWRVMAERSNIPLDIPIPDRYPFLTASGWALWDVCASCEREGSLDMHIRNSRPNAIGTLLADYPNIRRILCNGKTAHALLRRFFPELKAICLPSTSPANTLPYAQKKAAWFAAMGEIWGSEGPCL